ncbi:helix-turn-helix transcriptional regulator [Microbispora sp. NBRC 16548]|uniref:helix-turn-helix domain-containing protein n=1 Tax=Microbispora sp. NBRC 16548 TaxID=3030994 RepID=UPI0024A43689|nr:helix-turn-helix transcriptional regulator [Microbispora sp. NBRC 16548]GLX10729.1 helix-turn-helix transcriptional regulator [Microbispora sp. NBRC 16548]
MNDPRDRWPFCGRAEELETVRTAVRGVRRGVVVAGEAGVGRSRLAAEAVAGLAHVWVTGTRGGATLRFGAFAHLLPGSAADSLSRAVEALRWVRVLVVDDAHLLDDASAALVHHLAAHDRVRLLVTVRAGDPAPEAVTALWRRQVLPRLDLTPLSGHRTGELLASVLGAHVEELTVRRFHRICGGDLRLLRELVAATREASALDRVHGVWRWRGEVPVTATVRELVSAAVGEVDDAERETLELVAFAEPLAAGAAAVPVLERLEARGLVVIDDDLRVRLAHPLFGATLRAGVGRLRARRLSGTARPPRDVGQALAAQVAELTAGGYAGNVTALAPGVGERLAEDDAGWEQPGMADFCAGRAWLARLRGEVREAVAWSAEGMRRVPGHRVCSAELSRAAAHMGDLRTAEEALGRCGDDPSARAWVLAARGDLDGALRCALAAAEGDAGRAAGDGDDDLFVLHDVARLGAPELVTRRLDRLAETMSGDLAAVLADHAAALAVRDAAALDKAARRLADLGLLLHAAEAAAHAADAHRDGRAAAASRAYASALARACQGARTPALIGLATPRLTPRQRQIAGLAAAGLTNREIAQRLGLSIRTVANQLCRVYESLGSSDRSSLGRLIGLA